MDQREQKHTLHNDTHAPKLQALQLKISFHIIHIAYCISVQCKQKSHPEIKESI